MKLSDIKMLVSSGDTKEALDRFLEMSKLSYPAYANSAMLLNNRFTRLNNDTMSGLVSSKESDIEVNRIIQALLYYLNEMEK